MTDGRNTDGTFATGNSGKPKGARHKVTRAVEELLEGEAEEITRKAIDLAKGGDATALRLCMERIAPAPKDSPVGFELPDIETSKDIGIAARAVLQAVSQGDMTPAEGTAVMAVVDQFRRTLELTELEKRIAALEEQK